MIHSTRTTLAKTIHSIAPQRPLINTLTLIRNSHNSSSSDQSNSATILQGPSVLSNTGIPRPSPSLFYLPGLRSLPFWTAPPNTNTASTVAYNDPVVSSILSHVESHHDEIREEYLESTPHLAQDFDQAQGEHSSTHKLHEGKWDWHSYIMNGERQERFREYCPKTASCLDDIGDDLFGTPFAFAFFSTLEGGASIKPHTAPMNLRLRFHLPLIVPKSKSSSEKTCAIRVGNQTRQWIPGKALVLDDSYVHEVWNDCDEKRVLLLFDIWHPDVMKEERKRIVDMFEYAKGQGWIGNKGGGSGTGG